MITHAHKAHQYFPGREESKRLLRYVGLVASDKAYMDVLILTPDIRLEGGDGINIAFGDTPAAAGAHANVESR